MILTKEIDLAITEAGGNVRKALNVAMGKNDVATALLQIREEEVAALLVALEAIRVILWARFPPDTVTAKAIDDIARDALSAMGSAS